MDVPEVEETLLGLCKDRNRRGSRNGNAMVSLGVTWKDNTRNEHIRGTLKMDRFGLKVRQSRLLVYGHVKRQYDDYVDIKVLEMQLPRKI